MPTGMTKLGLLGLACALLVCPSEASAHPPGEVRLPIDWTGAPCLTIVDRSQGTIEAINYGILGEDEAPTEDEPPDSGWTAHALSVIGVISISGGGTDEGESGETDAGFDESAQGGCSCRASTPGSGGPGSAFAALVALGALLRRRPHT